MSTTVSSRRLSYANCRHSHWVYCIRIVRTGLIKIGSTHYLSMRLSTLKSRHSSDIEVLGICPGYRDDERAIHNQLTASLHHGREYYHNTDQVRDFVKGAFLPPEHFFHDFDRCIVESHRPRVSNIMSMNPETIHAFCDEVDKARAKKIPYISKLKPKSITHKIIREHANGFDVSQAIAIIRDRLGLEIAV